MIETLILSFLLGMLGGITSYLIINKSNNKYAKYISLNEKTKVCIYKLNGFNGSHIIHICDGKKDVTIEVKKTGINFLKYAEY